MNNFLMHALDKSNLSKAQVARNMDVTAQAITNLISRRETRPSTVAQFLAALGWDMERIKALTLAEVYGEVFDFTDEGEEA